MEISNIIANLTDNSKVNSNKSYSNKDLKSFSKILDQSYERTKFQKNLDKNIEVLKNDFSLDISSIENIKNLVKNIDKNVADEGASLYSDLSQEDLIENSLKEIISSLQSFISNNINLTSEEVSKTKQNLEFKVNLLEYKLTIEMDSINKLKNAMQSIEVNSLDKNIINSDNLSKELVGILQEVETNLNMNSSNVNHQEIIKVGQNSVKTSEEMNGVIGSIISDEKLSETSLKGNILSLQTLISSNINLTGKEVSNIKQNLESKLNWLEDKDKVSLEIISKLKSVLKGTFQNDINNDATLINNNLSRELRDILQEVQINLNMNSSNTNNQEITEGKENSIKTPEELNESIDNILPDKDLSEASLKDIVLSLQTLISSNINLTGEEISNIKQNLESKINWLEDKHKVSLELISKLKSVLKETFKNNVNNDATLINSNLSKELGEFLQEVQTGLNMNSSNVNYQEINEEKINSIKTPEELNKLIDNILPDKDLSEASLEDIVLSVQALISNNINLTGEEISKVKQKLESKIYLLEDKHKVSLQLISKLKSVLKGTPEDNVNNDATLTNNNSSKELHELLQQVQTNLNINSSNDNHQEITEGKINSIKTPEKLNKPMVNMLNDIDPLEDERSINKDYIYNIKRVLENIHANVPNNQIKNTNLNLSNENLSIKNNMNNLNNNITIDEASYKDFSEELVLKNIVKDSPEESKISKAMNFITHLNSAVETTKVTSEEKLVINKDTIVKDILKSVEYMETHNLKNLTVKINPKELGEVIIKVTMESGAMKASITAQNKETVSLLNSHLSELNDKLQQNNIRIDNLNINIYEDATYFGGQSGYENNGNNQKRKNSSSIINESNEEIDLTDNFNEELSNINMFA